MPEDATASSASAGTKALRAGPMNLFKACPPDNISLKFCNLGSVCQLSTLDLGTEFVAISPLDEGLSVTTRWLWLMALPALTLSAGLGAQATGAQTVLELEPGINPIGVAIAADRANGRYAIGDAVAISVTPVEDAFVYLFDVDAAGTVTQLYPNAHAPAAMVRGGEQRVYPSADAPWQIVADTAGIETIKVIVTKAPRDFAERSETVKAGPFKVFQQSGAALAGWLRAEVETGNVRWGTASLTIAIGQSGGLKAPPALTAAELKPRSSPLDRLPKTMPPTPVITPSLF